jgi:hypothetical protein
MNSDFTLNLGEFDSQLEAALAYDRAAILIFGDEADLNFPPEKSAHITFPREIMRKIEAAKRGKQLQ